jgi:DNA-directed RNA polymerase subunit RPC12/RpoP
MALIKCHECGNQVSDNAVACPECGAPVMVRLRRRQKAYLIRLGISLLFAAIVIFFSFLE